METALQKMGAIRRMADGGLIGTLKRAVGMAPAETVSEKYARQDAERAAKGGGEPGSSPAPKAAPASPAPGSISGYAAGSAMQAREKAAGLKKGGAIKGPGTGTSDDVPIMASNGEFMHKTKATRAMEKASPGIMDAINEIADGGKKVNASAVRKFHADIESKKEDEGESRKAERAEGYKCGGAIRKMATGGLVEDDEQRRAALIAQIPTGGAAPAYDGSASTELGRNVTNTANALGGASAALGTIPRASGAISKVLANTAGALGGLGTVATLAGASPALASPTMTAPVPSPVQPVAVAPTPPAAPVTAPAAPVEGQVIRNGNSFSGTNVTGNQVSSLDTSQGYAQDLKDLARIDATKAAEQANAKSQEAYAQNAMLQDRALRGNRGAGAIRATNIANATTQRGQDQQAQAQGAIQKLAQQKFGLESQTAGLDNASKVQMQAAQAKLLAAKTPEEKLAAEENLRALQGKYEKAAPPDQYAYAPGGQAVDPATGQMVTQPGVIFNKQTGEIKGPQAAPKQAQNFEKGKTYTDAKGRKAVWDGQKFVPA